MNPAGPVGSPTPAEDLTALRRAVQSQVEHLAYPSGAWAADDDDAGHLDVVVIGAGQAGITTAVKLRREGVRDVVVLDRAPAGQEGPWATWARMETLRTQKDLHGPDGGVPAATFRSWYSARHGEPAWEGLGLIPRAEWMAYLVWVREVFGVQVRNDTEVLDLVSDGSTATLRVRTGGDGHGVESELRARAVVICTGMDGLGGAKVPEFVSGLPRERWAHSSDGLRDAAYAGRRVAVLGAGASAFDVAATALEAGAERVIQLCRRTELPRLNALRSLETRGLFRHFGELPDELRLDFTRQYLSLPMPPPDHSVARCERFGNYELRLGADVASAELVGVAGSGGGAGSGVRLATTDGAVIELDLLVLGTGFVVDLDAVGWLGTLRPDVALWGDRPAMSTGASHPADPVIARHPYLDASMRLQGRDVAASARLRNIYVYSNAGFASVGPQCSGINSLPIGSETVVRGICSGLFAERGSAVLEEFVRATG